MSRTVTADVISASSDSQNFLKCAQKGHSSQGKVTPSISDSTLMKKTIENSTEVFVKKLLELWNFCKTRTKKSSLDLFNFCVVLAGDDIVSETHRATSCRSNSKPHNCRKNYKKLKVLREFSLIQKNYKFRT